MADYHNVRDWRGRFAPVYGGGSGSIGNETLVHHQTAAENTGGAGRSERASLSMPMMMRRRGPASPVGGGGAC